MYIERFLETTLFNLKNDYGALVITGPRRSGKSTLVKKILNDLGGGQYLDFDLLETKNLILSDPKYHLDPKSKLMVLDEIQNAPEILPYLKNFIDLNPNKLHFILTGSQNFSLMKGVTESLAGRAVILDLLPFSRKEKNKVNPEKLSKLYETFLNGKLNDLKKQISQIKENNFRNNLLKNILMGGYPQVTLNLVKDISLWFNSYSRTYIERDLRSLSNVSDLALFLRFIKFSAGRTGQLIDKTIISNELGIDQKTVSRWISLLTTGYLWFELPSYNRNIEKRLIKRSKGIFADSGLCCNLLAIENEKILEATPYLGSIFESFVIMELIKNFKHLRLRYNFYHFRTSDKNEVDLLIETPLGILPIEIKMTNTIKASHLKGIKKIYSYLGNNCTNFSYLLYTGNEIKEVGKNIWALPLSILI